MEQKFCEFRDSEGKVMVSVTQEIAVSNPPFAKIFLIFHRLLRTDLLKTQSPDLEKYQRFYQKQLFIMHIFLKHRNIMFSSHHHWFRTLVLLEEEALNFNFGNVLKCLTSRVTKQHRMMIIWVFIFSYWLSGILPLMISVTGCRMKYGGFGPHFIQSQPVVGQNSRIS